MELRVSGFLFKVVVKSVLIFGAYTWVYTPRMGWVLGRFQDQVERKFTGGILRQWVDMNWKYILEVEARAEAGFELMGDYICRR